ncbi:cytochrome C [Cupriavidus sp. SIMBA_020]|uniref:c-type cytochrome n=1 Tax=Cupriavidus sp. SIMBA_020 TaxID=3085766 RepID=UPI00397B421D
MKKTIALGLATLAVVVAGPSHSANASEGLAQKYACVGCHQANTRLVGPSWKEIATRYKNGSKSASDLAASIKDGGSGKWGAVPMPAQPQVPDADVGLLARWILSQK